MKKGRSTYNIEFNCDASMVNNLIQSYIQANNFTLQTKNGEQFYREGDAMLKGYRYFNYSITGNTLTIQAWFNSVLGDRPIEQSSVNMMAMEYRNSLVLLFNEISKLINGGNNMNNNEYQQEKLNNDMANQNINSNQINFESVTSQPIQNSDQFAQTFENDANKKKETMCEIGFWISILGLLGSFFGVVMGLLLYILDFYFAAQGLKTRKRGKAIATIIMSILSILVVVFTLIASN